MFDGELVDIGELFRSLPTKDDIRSMLANLEETYRRGLQDIRGEITHLSTRIDAAEVISAATETRLEWLEREQADTEWQLMELRLQLEDQEDRGRRNNLRIRGLPELEGQENLPAVVQVLFHLSSSLLISRQLDPLGPCLSHFVTSLYRPFLAARCYLPGA